MKHKLRETAQLNKFMFMLKFCGLWYYPEAGASRYRRLIQYARLLVMAVGYCLICLALYYSPGNRINNRNMPYFVFSFTSLIHSIIFLSNRLYLKAFVDGMRSLLERRDSVEERELFEELTHKTWSLLGIAFRLIVSFIVTYGFLPVLFDTVLVIIYGPEVPLEPPFPLEGLLPENKSRSLYFYSLYFTNCLFIFCYSFIYGGILGSICAAVTYIEFELRNIISKVMSWSKSNEPAEYRKKTLNGIIQDHCEILRLITLANNFIGLPVSSLNCISAVNMPIISHFATQFFAAKNITFSYIYVHAALFNLMSMFVTCHIGEIIHDKGQELANTLYIIDWHNESVETRYSLQMMLIASQRDIEISYRNKYPLKLRTFCELCNFAYSTFTLMQSAL